MAPLTTIDRHVTRYFRLEKSCLTRDAENIRQNEEDHAERLQQKTGLNCLNKPVVYVIRQHTETLFSLNKAIDQ